MSSQLGQGRTVPRIVRRLAQTPSIRNAGKSSGRKFRGFSHLLTQRSVDMATNDGGDDLSNWKEMTDKNTGKKFYYNTVTRKTQWTLPKATAVAEQVNVESDRQTNDHTSSTATAESRSDWKEMTDKNSGKTFYYNVKTRKTQWEKPAEFETSGRAKKTSNADISGSETMDKGATNEAESESVIAAEKTTTSHPTGDWISRTDPNTQRVYYFNKRTNKTQWEEPVEMQTAPTEDRGKATVETSLNAESADKDASEWKEMTDKTSGRKFYYNVNTKKTQWNKPLEVPSKPALIAAQKEASGTVDNSRKARPNTCIDIVVDKEERQKIWTLLLLQL